MTTKRHHCRGARAALRIPHAVQSSSSLSRTLRDRWLAVNPTITRKRRRQIPESAGYPNAFGFAHFDRIGLIKSLARALRSATGRLARMSTAVDPAVPPSGTGLRRVRCGRRLVGAPAPLRGVRAHRVLRRFAWPGTRSAHWRETGHPIIRSFEPGEDWFWNYDDERVLTTGPNSPRRNAIPRTSQFQGRATECPRTGSASCAHVATERSWSRPAAKAHSPYWSRSVRISRSPWRRRPPRRCRVRRRCWPRRRIRGPTPATKCS